MKIVLRIVGIIFVVWGVLTAILMFPIGLVGGGAFAALGVFMVNKSHTPKDKHND